MEVGKVIIKFIWQDTQGQCGKKKFWLLHIKWYYKIIRFHTLKCDVEKTTERPCIWVIGTTKIWSRILASAEHEGDISPKVPGKVEQRENI